MPVRTPPGGIRAAEYQEYVAPNGYGFWKVVATSGWSLLAGILLAWWTARDNKGITRKELTDYDKESSTYIIDRKSLLDHNTLQDGWIGELRGKQEKNATEISDVKTKQRDDEHDQADLSAKVKLFGDYVEEQRKLRR